MVCPVWIGTERVPRGFTAASPQTAKLYTVDLKNGPKVAAGGSLTTMPIGSWQSFMGHVVAVDKDSDWRTDVAYWSERPTMGPYHGGGSSIASRWVVPLRPAVRRIGVLLTEPPGLQRK